MKRITVVLLSVVMMTLAACGQAPASDGSGNGSDNGNGNVHEHISNDDIVLASLAYEQLQEHVDDRIIVANEQFALQLYETIVAQSDELPAFISPLSINIALAMVYNGSDGETRQQLADALQLTGMTMEEVNRGYNALQHLVEKADPDVQLSIANSIWAREGIAFHDAFLALNQHYYAAEVSELDFSDEEAVDTINAWVDRHTESKISEIIEGPISDDIIMYLLNAIYFKGDWTKPFEEDMTIEQPFYLSNGETITHPLMAQSGQFDYIENKHFQAIRLPYGEEENVSMLVFLPSESSDLDTFQSMLTVDNWLKWKGEFESMEGLIRLPRFTMQYEETLNDMLQSIGIVDAFSPHSADFSNMLQTSPTANAYISSVRHKSIIEVNEVGTEAAAVTGISVGLTSVRTDFFNMTVNRPFFFAIVEEATDTILFMGAVEHPEDI